MVMSMDNRLTEILEALLLNVEVLNREIERLSRTEQFSPTPQSRQLIEKIRGSCTNSLQNLHTAELGMNR